MGVKMDILLGLLAAFGLIYGATSLFTEDDKQMQFGLRTLSLTLTAIVVAVLYTQGVI